MSEFKLEIKGLERLRKSFKESPKVVRAEMARGVKSSVLFLQLMMRREVPVKTGKLKKNIDAHTDFFGNNLRGRVGPNLSIVKYGFWVHEGTKPYTIRPRTKQALWWPGLRHPVKLVRHPGIKKNPYIPRTITKSEGQVNKIFEKLTDRIIEHLGQ